MMTMTQLVCYSKYYRPELDVFTTTADCCEHAVILALTNKNYSTL